MDILEQKTAKTMSGTTSVPLHSFKQTFVFSNKISISIAHRFDCVIFCFAYGNFRDIRFQMSRISEKQYNIQKGHEPPHALFIKSY